METAGSEFTKQKGHLKTRKSQGLANPSVPLKLADEKSIRLF
jgi:hypothetical protein